MELQTRRPAIALGQWAIVLGPGLMGQDWWSGCDDRLDKQGGFDKQVM